MKHVVCEMTSPVSYRLIINGVTSPVVKVQTIQVGKNKDDVVNPAHNQAWAQMLAESND